ncbi:hypothetical protein ACH5RR_006309 [Cinchona calisaya]|uniref:Uncharacterized protein n=1 Tax=Cinchona calisaya TaxID=153742 RepID=A0ABD3ANY9_9GENT
MVRRDVVGVAIAAVTDGGSDAIQEGINQIAVLGRESDRRREGLVQKTEGMATEFQYATNPLARTVSNNSFAVYQLGDWGYSRDIVAIETWPLHHLKHSMDERFDLQQNIESIKKTMLMHEDIFRRQVRELHRLYGRQMKLMYELKTDLTHNHSPLARKDVSNTRFTTWDKQMQDARSNLPVYGLTHEAEWSASCSGESLRVPKGLNLERVVEEVPSTSIHLTEQDQERPNSCRYSKNNTKNMATCVEEEIDVELTLSIGCNKSKKRLSSQMKTCSLELGGSDSNYNDKEHCSSALIKREMGEDFGDSSPALSSSSATLNQNSSRSHWLFQDLSLNRT